MAMSTTVGCEMDETQDALLKRYVECAEYLIDKCREMIHITGAQKLERKCIAELKYLRSLSRRKGGFDVSHLRSSNLSHYLGVAHAAENLPEVTQILQAFRCPGRNEPLHVDVVAGQGHLWVKVIARKGQALHLIWAGQGQYGERDILLQAEDYVICSAAHPVNFVDPKVVFSFYNGVSREMAKAFVNANVIVLGNEVDLGADVEEKLKHLNVDSDSDTDDSSDGDICHSEKGISDVKSPDLNIIAKTSNIPVKDSFTVSEYCDVENVISSKSKSEITSTETKDVDNGSHASTFSKPENLSIVSSGDMLTDLSSTNTAYPIVSSVTQAAQIKTSDVLAKETSDKTKIISLEKNSHGPINTNIISVDKHFPENQLQTQLHLPNQSIGNKQQLANAWDLRNHSALPFIEGELLTFPLVKYDILDSILVRNKENTIENITRVNLDITALITLVSSVSHGGCYFEFQEKILSEQAAEERLDPVLPKLEKFLEGKELFACNTAIASFQTILDTLGGESEKARAAKLLERVTVVEDNHSFRAATLPITGKIKERSKVIFGTGDSLRAVTATANLGFVRAAEHQGVLFAAYLHASRALTENKEKTAKRIADFDSNT